MGLISVKILITEPLQKKLGIFRNCAAGREVGCITPTVEDQKCDVYIKQTSQTHLPSRKIWVKFKNIEKIKSKITYLGNCHKNISSGLIS